MKDEPYISAYIQCLDRYAGMTDDKTLLEFIQEARYRVWNISLPKLSRWIGYIQGTLIAAGITTVQIERDWTRPLFSELDRKLMLYG